MISMLNLSTSVKVMALSPAAVMALLPLGETAKVVALCAITPYKNTLRKVG
jgi:hypothetical protein